MPEYAKNLPDIPPMHAPFWDAVKRHELSVQKCIQCGHLRFIPTEICNRCYSEDWLWQPLTGKGTVYTYVVVHRAALPAEQAEAPYLIVSVELEEGVRMMSNLIDCPIDQVEIGMPVEVVYETATPEIELFKFRPVGERRGSK